jgi:hypothetical protein
MLVRLVVLTVVAVGVLPVPGGAEPAGPILAGKTTVTATGSASTPITVPAGAQLQQRVDPPRSPGFARITTTGAWAAVALVAVDQKLVDGRTPAFALQVHLARPWGCTGATREVVCIDPLEHALTALPSPPSATPEVARWPVDPGRYNLIIVGQPGATTTVDLDVADIPGTSTVEATQPVTATIDVAHDATAPLAVVNKAFTREVARPTLAALGMFHIGGSDPVPAGPFTYAECLVRGEAAPANPEDCLVGAVAGDQTVGGTPVLKRPTTFAQSAGGFSLDNSGHNTIAAYIDPGRYTASHRTVRGGVAPAVGGFAAWIELP